MRDKLTFSSRTLIEKSTIFNNASIDNNSFGSSESGLRWVIHDNIAEKIKLYKFDS
jgi:hypothetical protein